jgi:hypothetical protein
MVFVTLSEKRRERGEERGGRELLHIGIAAPAFIRWKNVPTGYVRMVQNAAYSDPDNSLRMGVHARLLQ